MNSRFKFHLVVLLVLTAASDVATPAKADYPPKESLQEVRALIENAPKHHPRLIADSDQFDKLQQSIDKDPTRRALARAIVTQAEQLLSVEPITRQLQGRRLLDQSRRCVERVLVLSFAYRLTGDSRFLHRCETEMNAAAGFKDWNPSHFLDVAEMTFALAIGYDWLFEDLSPETRDNVRRTIVSKGVALPFETRHKGWVRSTNNWGQVCHGGLTAGALAVMEDEPELAAKTVHNAIQNVTRSMAVYEPRGSYPEGPGYWAYGTSYNVLLIAVLESALGTDFDLAKAPGFGLTGQYPALVTGPSGLTFNYADGGAGRLPQASLFWLAKRFNRPDWLLGELDRVRSSITQIQDGNSARNRLLPLALLWMNAEDKPAPIQLPLHWSSEGETPITVHRSSWHDANATFVGIKAGSPSANHGQMDIGSFVLDADGVRWAHDLGAEGYHGIESRGMNLWGREQDSDRWKIFRQCNAGHNTLVIDGGLQQASAHAKVIGFSDSPHFSHTIVDMSPIYEGQAESVLRGVALLPSGEVLIQDEIKGQPGTKIRWGMMTHSTPRSIGSSRTVLEEQGRSLVLHLLGNNADPWQVIDISKPKNPWDSPNPGMSMLTFEATIAESGFATLAVLATPGSCQSSLDDAVKIERLQDWSGRVQ